MGLKEKVLRRHVIYALPDGGAEIEEVLSIGFFKRRRRVIRFMPDPSGTVVMALVEGIRVGIIPMPVGTAVQLEVGDEIFLPGGAKFTVTK